MLRKFVPTLLFAAALFTPAHDIRAQVPPSQTLVIDLSAKATPFPHYWEQAFGSGRAILSLRESYRNDLREVKKITDFRYVRFHAIFHDELGVYDEDENGKPIFNFSYVGQVYDGLLANGVRPFVEISFMPKKLALRQDLHPFWYKQNVSPPKDYAKWDALIRNFAQFLIARYGIDEVSQWYFEVWNEPNIDFWSGDPKQSTYFELYDHTARALKSVNPRLRVGGPATSSAHWVDDFIAHVSQNHVPVDFVSTHGYSDDTVEDLFGAHEEMPIEKRACKAVEKVHNQVKASALPNLPLFWTEWNVSGYGPLHAGDTSYSATATAQTIRDCDGMLDMLARWTFSDVFEENGPPREPVLRWLRPHRAGRNQEAKLLRVSTLSSAGNHQNRQSCREYPCYPAARRFLGYRHVESVASRSSRDRAYLRSDLLGSQSSEPPTAVPNRCGPQQYGLRLRTNS